MPSNEKKVIVVELSRRRVILKMHRNIASEEILMESHSYASKVPKRNYSATLDAQRGELEDDVLINRFKKSCESFNRR